MPGFEIPDRPVFEKFPQIDNKLPFSELTTFCNKVYDQFKELVGKAEPALARKLLGGLHKDKVWALHRLRELHQEHQNEKQVQYCAALDAARRTAEKSDVVKKLHRDILTPLARPPKAAMTKEQLDEIHWAVEAVWNAEKETEEQDKRQSQHELKQSEHPTNVKKAFEKAEGQHGSKGSTRAA